MSRPIITGNDILLTLERDGVEQTDAKLEGREKWIVALAILPAVPRWPRLLQQPQIQRDELKGRAKQKTVIHMPNVLFSDRDGDTNALPNPFVLFKCFLRRIGWRSLSDTRNEWNSFFLRVLLLKTLRGSLLIGS